MKGPKTCPECGKIVNNEPCFEHMSLKDQNDWVRERYFSLSEQEAADRWERHQAQPWIQVGPRSYQRWAPG